MYHCLIEDKTKCAGHGNTEIHRCRKSLACEPLEPYMEGHHAALGASLEEDQLAHLFDIADELPPKVKHAR